MMRVMQLVHLLFRANRPLLPPVFIGVIIVWPIFPLYFFNLYGSVGYLDPWVYTGYINSYNDLYERYGLTYYSTRISAIFPSAFLSNQFGDLGYLIIRYLHFLVAQIIFFSIAKKFFSVKLSLLLSMLLVIYPLYINAYSDDYVGGFATTYSLVALYALIIIEKTYLRYFTFGFFASLSFNSYEGFALYTLAPMFAAFIFTEFKSIGKFLRSLSLAFLGFLICQLSLSTVYIFSIKNDNVKFFFQTASIEMAQWLFEGGAKNWSVGFFSPYLFIVSGVVFILIYLAIFQKRSDFNSISRNKFMSDGKFLLVWSFLTLGLILHGHFVQQSALLGYSHPMSFWIPLFSYFLIYLCKSDPEARLMPYTILIVFLSIFVFKLFNNFSVNLFLTLLIVSTFLVYLILDKENNFNYRSSLIKLIISSLIFIYIFLSPLPGFKLTLPNSSRAGVDGKEVYIAAREFQYFVHKNAGNNVIFWYPGNVPHFHSIQSTFLWGYSCLVCASGPEFPQFNEEMYKVIEGRSDLIIISLNRQQLLSAITNLSSYHDKYNLIVTKNISNGDLEFLVSIIKLN
jgi:hypothetical protein